MGVFDKIKNALFEEEYVEVEEKPKAKIRPKKEKSKREPIKVHENKPIAKKVVLPEKKEERVDDYDDYKPRDEDFEIVPERNDEEETKEDFKFPAVDDQEFSDKSYYNEPKIVEVVKKEEVHVEENPDLYHGSSRREADNYSSNHDYYGSSQDTYHGSSSVQDAYHGSRDKNLYHSDYNESISIHEYGTYEKEKKTVFKPSPIISPIYGILDKNYKKEEIVPKREVHLSSYTREHMTVDDVRRKAYGNLADDIAADINGDDSSSDVKEEKESVFNDESDNLLVDLSEDNEKPHVSEVTMGDAEEYYKDLGLEYNIDYKDSSKEKAIGRRVTEDYDEEEKKTESLKSKDNSTKEEQTATDPASDDNLFDLIDSMYEDENKE